MGGRAPQPVRPDPPPRDDLAPEPGAGDVRARRSSSSRRGAGSTATSSTPGPASRPRTGRRASRSWPPRRPRPTPSRRRSTCWGRPRRREYLPSRPDVGAIFVLDGQGTAPRDRAPQRRRRGLRAPTRRSDCDPSDSLTATPESLPRSRPRRGREKEDSPGRLATLLSRASSAPCSSCSCAMAIGWHFLYEGVYKINTTPAQRDTCAGPRPDQDPARPARQGQGQGPAVLGRGLPPQRHRAARPAVPRMVPDVNSLAEARTRRDGLPTRLKASWRAEMDGSPPIRVHDAEQKADGREGAGRRVGRRSTSGSSTRRTPRTIKKYYRDLRHVLRRRGIARVPALPEDAGLQGPAGGREGPQGPGRRGRRRSAAPCRTPGSKLATPEQRKAAGRVPAALDAARLDQPHRPCGA